MTTRKPNSRVRISRKAARAAAHAVKKTRAAKPVASRKAWQKGGSEWSKALGRFPAGRRSK